MDEPHRWIDVGGVSLRYAVGGTGPTRVVLIHEMGGALESWDGVVAALPRDLGVLRYDLRGFGLSEKIRGRADMADLVSDLRGLLDALDVQDPVALAGCAVGAAVALSFALDHPERVSRVMAMAPATGVAPDRREHARAYVETLSGGGLRDLVVGGLDRTFPARFRSDPAAFAAARGRLLANDPDSYAAVYRMLIDLSLEERLPALTRPALFVAGAVDTARPPDRVAPLAALVPDGASLVLDTGHAMAVLTPRLVADALLRFLTDGCEKLD